MPHRASLPLGAALPSLLSQLLDALSPSDVNTPPYPALKVIFSLFPSLPDLDQAPTERGGAMIHDGTWPVVPSPCSFFTLLLPPQLCAASFTWQSLLLYLHPIRSVGLPSLQWASLHSMTRIRRQLTSQRMRATANRPTLTSTRTLLMRICRS